jgi:hypothetical protein
MKVTSLNMPMPKVWKASTFSHLTSLVGRPAEGHQRFCGRRPWATTLLPSASAHCAVLGSVPTK